MILTVARIGRAHGLRGEVSLELRTDIPEERLAVGDVLDTDPPEAGPLTVASAREQGGRWYVAFEECSDRSAAEALRGVLLTVEEDASDEEDAWYLHEIEGLPVVRPDGSEIGVVAGLEHLPAQDLLVVREPNGNRARIPFVAELVPTVDLPGGRIVANPPFGLLSGETPEASGETRG